ncbi:MAG: XdhC family protein [Blautia sp.]
MYQEIFEEVKQKGCARCATVLEGPYAGSKYLFTEEGGQCWGAMDEDAWEKMRAVLLTVPKTAVSDCQGTPVLVEWIYDRPRMVICGGGHVSSYVCQLGKMLGFHVTVMDDRPEFACTERFPEADRCICQDLSHLADEVPPHPNTYYVVVTRGHAHDETCVRQVLQRPYRYLGMIGSKTKVARTKENLLMDGYTKEQVDSIYAPIGLKLGGQLPEEIAVSIAAEIIQVKNKRYTDTLDEKIESAVEEKEEGVMVTIIAKHGSSPRGTGSKMLVCSGQQIYGSVGGGAVEYEAIQEAKRLMGQRKVQSLCASYVLNQEQAKNLGMVCGGEIQVLFECL